MSIRIRTARLAAAAATAATAAALLAAPATAVADPAPTAVQAAVGHAVFVQTDDVTGNHVAAYRQNADGSLTLADTYATGGLGGILPTSVIDHLASEGAVTYDATHRLLFVVNAGSDSVSVFGAQGPHLELLQVLPSGGTFPVSVDVKGDVAYVVNAQQGGTIQGYRITGRHVSLQPDWNRPLGLDASLTRFTQTPGQVAITPDGSQLLVTTKANGNDVLVWNLDRNGAPSATFVRNHEDGTVPFAIAFGGPGTVAIGAAGTASVITYRLGADGVLSEVANVPSGQRGTCWVVRGGQFLFTTNPGSATVTTYGQNADGSTTVLSSATTHPGTVDPVASTDGRFLYVETGAQGVVDEFAIGTDGTLSALGSVTVANAVGAEGIAVS